MHSMLLTWGNREQSPIIQCCRNGLVQKLQVAVMFVNVQVTVSNVGQITNYSLAACCTYWDNIYATTYLVSKYLAYIFSRYSIISFYKYLCKYEQSCLLKIRSRSRPCAYIYVNLCSLILYVRKYTRLTYRCDVDCKELGQKQSVNINLAQNHWGKCTNQNLSQTRERLLETNVIINFRNQKLVEASFTYTRKIFENLEIQ